MNFCVHFLLSSVTWFGAKIWRQEIHSTGSPKTMRRENCLAGT